MYEVKNGTKQSTADVGRCLRMGENDQTCPLLDTRCLFSSHSVGLGKYAGHHGFGGLPPFQFNHLIYDYDWTWLSAIDFALFVHQITIERIHLNLKLPNGASAASAGPLGPVYTCITSAGGTPP